MVPRYYSTKVRVFSNKYKIYMSIQIFDVFCYIIIFRENLYNTTVKASKIAPFFLQNCRKKIILCLNYGYFCFNFNSSTMSWRSWGYKFFLTTSYMYIYTNPFPYDSLGSNQWGESVRIFLVINYNPALFYVDKVNL